MKDLQKYLITYIGKIFQLNTGLQAVKINLNTGGMDSWLIQIAVTSETFCKDTQIESWPLWS